MVTELQLETSDNSVFGEVDMTEAAWDQEELPKVKPSSHPSNLVWKGFAFFTFLPYTKSVMGFYNNTSTGFTLTEYLCQHFSVAFVQSTVSSMTLCASYTVYNHAVQNTAHSNAGVGHLLVTILDK